MAPDGDNELPEGQGGEGTRGIRLELELEWRGISDKCMPL